MSKILDQTGLSYFWQKIKALLNGKLGTSDTAHKAASIPMGEVDSTSTSTVFTATVDGITELRDGVCMWLTNGVVTSASGFTINVNNLGAKPVYSSLATASRSTTIFNVAYTMLFVYNESRVSGGCWDIVYGYDSNTNTVGFRVRHNSGTGKASAKTYSYRLLFTGDDDTLVPANTSSSADATAVRAVNQTPIDPFGPIYYYDSTSSVDANNSFGAASLWQQYAISLGYSFNRTGAALTLSYPKAVYVKATPTNNGKAIIDANTPYVQTLPSTEDGKIYIYLGQAYSATNVELDLHHPVYEYKGGKIRLYTGASSNSGLTDVLVNGVSVVSNNVASIPVATTTAPGVMSATDKSHLDAVYDDYITALAALLGDTAETIWEGSVMFELYEGEFGDYYTGYAEWEGGSSPSMVFGANEQWRVTIDGTAYTASTSYYEYGEIYYLGNTKYDDPMGQVDDGSGVPFTIIGSEEYWQGGFDPSIFTLSTHTIKFERLNT